MNYTAEQFTATNQANFQALETLATQAFAGVEKLVELNMQASKALLNESFAHAQAVLAAKDAQELLALHGNLLKPLADKTAAYAQHVQSIVAESGAELTKLVEAKSAEAQKSFNGAVETLAKNAPAGTESAVAAFKNAITAGQDAVESAQSSAKKAAVTAQSNFAAANTQVVDAVVKATKASSAAA